MKPSHNKLSLDSDRLRIRDISERLLYRAVNGSIEISNFFNIEISSHYIMETFDVGRNFVLNKIHMI